MSSILPGPGLGPGRASVRAGSPNPELEDLGDLNPTCSELGDMNPTEYWGRTGVGGWGDRECTRHNGTDGNIQAQDIVSC